MKTARAFTVAELLIAVSILGIIATFTIPKVLDANSTHAARKSKALAKAAVMEVANAYTKYKLDNAPLGTTKISDLTPYMNYIKKETGGLQIDENPGEAGPVSCSGANECLQMASGGILVYQPARFFGGTLTTHSVWFQFDPNGKLDNTTTVDGPGKALHFRLYYNGRIRTIGSILNNSCDDTACDNPAAGEQPSWFTFD